MAHASAFLSQTKYYSPALNAAIFDGPVRIYFAQHQESAALQVYFRIQGIIKNTVSQIETFRRADENIFIMLYPTADSFDMCFNTQPAEGENIAKEYLDQDVFIAARGPLTEKDHQCLTRQFEETLKAWQPSRPLDLQPTL